MKLSNCSQEIPDASVMPWPEILITCCGRDSPTRANCKLATISTSDPFRPLVARNGVCVHFGSPKLRLRRKSIDVVFVVIVVLSSSLHLVRASWRVSPGSDFDGRCLISQRMVRPALVNDMWPRAVDVCRIVHNIFQFFQCFL